jgi:hypothetical protein
MAFTDKIEKTNYEQAGSLKIRLVLANKRPIQMFISNAGGKACTI